MEAFITIHTGYIRFYCGNCQGSNPILNSELETLEAVINLCIKHGAETIRITRSN